MSNKTWISKKAACCVISEMLRELRKLDPGTEYTINIFNTGLKVNSKTVTNAILVSLETYFVSQKNRRK